MLFDDSDDEGQPDVGEDKNPDTSEDGDDENDLGVQQ